MNIELSEKLKIRYGKSLLGILFIKGISNSDNIGYLDEIKNDTSLELRNKYSHLSREEIIADPVLTAYRDYYKKFKKTYHILLQLESIVKKGRSFSSVNPLVDSCFLAEMKTFVLTAGHDAALLGDNVVFDLSGNNDEFTQINGKSIILKPDDIIMKSRDINVCSIIYGQDNSTVISDNTDSVFYVSYAPEGVPESSVIDNLELIEKYIHTISPKALTEINEVLKIAD